MDNAYAQLVQVQKEEIANLKVEIESLHAQVMQKDRELETLTNYIKELESRNQEITEVLDEKKNSLKAIQESAKSFGVEIDELLHMLFYLQNQEKIQDSNAYIQSVQLNEDKDLLFGLNIANEFLAQSSEQTIKYYLFNLGCKFYQTFDLPNLHPQNKTDLILIGETFSSFVCLQTYNQDESLRGLIEMLPADMLNPVQIRYYGNLDLRGYFELFVQKLQQNDNAI
ncbi:MAG: hypothetical protein MR629_03335 [Helicobacter sp.]|uniref:hypothetical protein n=1 Tax=Helicobacter sp. 10-6591 TaxID=2004998 RepID=UPI000DCC46BB|nr:hypothetical protein [Helicobacter sp. 10-6591]MCI6217560.1 hypothetical protein [Helicobacter sp.]MCI7485044.1 hypothetical protein [Helicobacter sp.]MDD7568149.1 hypothetical protein [Helicobacter sp.]MDY5741237.1 hypothetical protein [Helicobacter sp.]RAX52973.1 hypothetical protein CCY97_07360 [Helicobacter sp. 10-6591]